MNMQVDKARLDEILDATDRDMIARGDRIGAKLARDLLEVFDAYRSLRSTEGKEEVTREQMDAWLEANCGAGLPYAEATDDAGMLHGLAYVLRQIESSSTYRPHIGQCTPATSALRMALDHFARAALTRSPE